MEKTKIMTKEELLAADALFASGMKFKCTGWMEEHPSHNDHDPNGFFVISNLRSGNPQIWCGEAALRTFKTWDDALANSTSETQPTTDALQGQG